MTNDNEEKQMEAQTEPEPEEQDLAGTSEDSPPAMDPEADRISEEGESPGDEVAEEGADRPQPPETETGDEESVAETMSVQEEVSSEPSGESEEVPEEGDEEPQVEESEEASAHTVEPADAEVAEQADQQPEVAETEEGVPSEIAETEEESEDISPEDKSKEIVEDPDKAWYVIHAHSGHENKVRQSLENRVRQEHLEEFVGKILIPSEEVAEVKGGKKRISSRKIFPGYVLIQMKLTHETWYLIRTTPGVTGFIGSGKTPTPLDREEVQSIFDQMRGERKKPKPKMTFEKDEKVKIIEGPFTNFMGYVDEVNPERGKLKVMVEIFERLTSVELEFWQVEKI